MTYGFIGTGNMAGALVRAAVKCAAAEDILLANRTRKKAERLAAELGCRATDNETAARTADMIFLGVKPQMMPQMLGQIAPILRARKERFVLVSMAAGLSIAQIQSMAGGDYPVIRIMPNLAASVGEGVIFYTAGAAVSAEETEAMLALFAKAGRCYPLAEELFGAGSAIAGCGAAYVSLFVEALADGGVSCGLPRAVATECAEQMLFGAAKLLLAGGEHPAVVKDKVCSPGGTTIQGVRALERAGFRSAVIEAVTAAYEKDRALGSAQRAEKGVDK